MNFKNIDEAIKTIKDTLHKIGIYNLKVYEGAEDEILIEQGKNVIQASIFYYNIENIEITGDKVMITSKKQTLWITKEYMHLTTLNFSLFAYFK